MAHDAALTGLGAGQYGVVCLTRGRHAGRVGYYGLDQGSKAVVYLGAPFAAPFVIVTRAILRAAPQRSFVVERWIEEFPGIAAHLGVTSALRRAKDDRGRSRKTGSRHG